MPIKVRLDAIRGASHGVGEIRAGDEFACDGIAGDGLADTGALELTFIEVYRFKDRTCHTVPTNSASGAASQISVSASN